MPLEQPETHNQEDLSPVEIEERAERALDNVKAFFAKYGIELNTRPKVKYLDMNCPVNTRMIAAANIDIESTKRLLGITGVTVMKSGYRHFHLEVSDEAANEAVAVVQNELAGLFAHTPLFKDGEDVDLFLPIREMLDELDPIMAHESWHLVEKSLGVIVTEPLILEATATYVQNLMAGKSCKNPSIEDHFDVMYTLGAAIVEEEVANEPNPLQALLNPEVRKRIERRFQSEALPLFEQKVSKSYDPELSRNFQKHMIKTHPSYEKFRQDPTADNLLHVARIRGYIKLAEDLSKQDMTQLLEYSRKLLLEE